jgi:hypothetical protein
VCRPWPSYGRARCRSMPMTRPAAMRGSRVLIARRAPARWCSGRATGGMCGDPPMSRHPGSRPSDQRRAVTTASRSSTRPGGCRGCHASRGRRPAASTRVPRQRPGAIDDRIGAQGTDPDVGHDGRDQPQFLGHRRREAGCLAHRRRARSAPGPRPSLRRAAPAHSSDPGPFGSGRGETLQLVLSPRWYCAEINGGQRLTSRRRPVCDLEPWHDSRSHAP